MHATGIGSDVAEYSVLAGPVSQLLTGGVEIVDPVDQVEPEGILGHQRPGLQGGLQGGGRLAAVGCSPVDRRAVDRFQHGLGRLPVGRGVVGLLVTVDCVLEFLALLEVGLDTVAIEEALQEDVLRGQACGLQGGSRLHPDLAACRRQHVGRGRGARGIEALAEDDHGLAGLAKAAQGVGDLVGHGGCHAGLRQAHQEAADMIVRLGLAQGGDDPHHGQGGLPETGEGVGPVLVGDLLPQIELDHCPCGNGLGPRGPSRQDDQQEGYAHEEQHQTGEDASHGQ